MEKKRSTGENEGEAMEKMKGKIAMKINRAIIVLGIISVTGGGMAGCGSDPAAVSGNESGSEIAVIQGTDVETPQSASPGEPQTAGQMTQAGNQEGTGNQENGQEVRWHVLDPDTAEAVGADFLGKVCKLDEDSFWIVEVQAKVLEDGSTVTSSPASNVEIPDSDLIQVVFDENTRFYIRTIYNGGESHEDSEAAFSDLGEGVSVDLKGSFQNDVFHATEVQVNKIA